MKHRLRKDCISCDYRCELGGILTFRRHSYEEKATTAVPLRKSSSLFTRILFRNLFLVSINLSQGHFVFTRFFFFCLPLGLLSGLQKKKNCRLDFHKNLVEQLLGLGGDMHSTQHSGSRTVVISNVLRRECSSQNNIKA